MDKFNKKLSKSGAVTLPAAMRRDLGLQDGERFSIGTIADGSIVLRRVQGECLFCKAEDKLTVHAGRYVCAACIESMSAKARA